MKEIKEQMTKDTSDGKGVSQGIQPKIMDNSPQNVMKSPSEATIYTPAVPAESRTNKRKRQFDNIEQAIQDSIQKKTN